MKKENRQYKVISKDKPPEGWKNVADDSDHMLFARAESIARLCAFNTKSVYEWAIREDNDLSDILNFLVKGNVTKNPLFQKLFDSIILGMPFTFDKPATQTNSKQQ
jgi:hypothetical protein